MNSSEIEGREIEGREIEGSEIESSETQATRTAPTLWGIGGGKGGVGKSLITTSLAISFARRGHRCAVIDLDLGAANVHSLLGVNAPAFTLSDFLDNKMTDLGELFCSTPHPNLKILSGARASLGAANPKHCQKEKLLRHIRALDYDHIFLDLSAGCAFNALDFFLAADHRIAVVIPERTSIENTQHFLKTAFFRSLRKVAQKQPMRGLIMEALAAGHVGSARDLIRGVSNADAEQGALLAGCAADFSPMLIVNQIESASDRNECEEISRSCRHYLAAGASECGALPRDRHVRDALGLQEHVLTCFPEAPFTRAVCSLAADLMDGTSLSPSSTLSEPVEPVEPVEAPVEKSAASDELAPAATATPEPAHFDTPPSSPPLSPPVTPPLAPPSAIPFPFPLPIPSEPVAPLMNTVEPPERAVARAHAEEPGEFLRFCREQQRPRQAGEGRRPWVRSLGELAAASGASGQAHSAMVPPLSARPISTPTGRFISPPLMKRRTS
jgi:flagellar biosynthesis protein FlhG